MRRKTRRKVGRRGCRPAKNHVAHGGVARGRGLLLPRPAGAQTNALRNHRAATQQRCQGHPIRSLWRTGSQADGTPGGDGISKGNFSLARLHRGRRKRWVARRQRGESGGDQVYRGAIGYLLIFSSGKEHADRQLSRAAGASAESVPPSERTVKIKAKAVPVVAPTAGTAINGGDGGRCMSDESFSSEEHKRRQTSHHTWPDYPRIAEKSEKPRRRRQM